jgi:hypothetical protein
LGVNAHPDARGRRRIFNVGCVLVHTDMRRRRRRRRRRFNVVGALVINNPAEEEEEIQRWSSACYQGPSCLERKWLRAGHRHDPLLAGDPVDARHLFALAVRQVREALVRRDEVLRVVASQGEIESKT